VNIGDIGGALLEPIQQATDLVSEAIGKLGEGVEWTGEQIEAFALLVGVLAAKVEELQAAARGDDEASDPAAQ
jgi:phage-related tail protein